MHSVSGLVAHDEVIRGRGGVVGEWYERMEKEVLGWCDVMWYDMIWYDVIWCDFINMIWYNTNERNHGTNGIQ